jgi:hypothetical protein
MSGKRLNDASVRRIGFMHMLSIVQMLYLSSKSLFVHTPKQRDAGDGGRRKRVPALWVIAY